MSVLAASAAKRRIGDFIPTSAIAHCNVRKCAADAWIKSIERWCRRYFCIGLTKWPTLCRVRCHMEGRKQALRNRSRASVQWLLWAHSVLRSHVPNVTAGVDSCLTSLVSKCRIECFQQSRIAERLKKTRHNILSAQAGMTSFIFLGRNKNCRNIVPPPF